MSENKNNQPASGSIGDSFLALGSQLMSLAPVIDRLHDALNSRLQHDGDQVFHEIAENRIRDAKRDFDKINATIQAALALSTAKGGASGIKASSKSKRFRLEFDDREFRCRSCCGLF